MASADNKPRKVLGSSLSLEISPTFFALLLLSFGLIFTLLAPALFILSSLMFAAGIAVFLHLYLDGLDQSQLEIDASNDSILLKTFKLVGQAKFTGSIVVFFVVWIILLVCNFFLSRDQKIQLRKIVGDPNKNSLDILLDEREGLSDSLKVRLGDIELGVVTDKILYESLKKLAVAAAKKGKQTDISKRILIECSRFSGICQVPYGGIPVKVSFAPNIGANHAHICLDSTISAMNKISGSDDLILSGALNNPEPVEIRSKNITAPRGINPCDIIDNWIQLDQVLYREKLSKNNNERYVDALLFFKE